jgi:hypothetical protein
VSKQNESQALRLRAEAAEAKVAELGSKLSEEEDWRKAFAASHQECVEELQRILGFPKPEEIRKWRWVLDEVEELKEKADAKAQPAPDHVVRAFERGAKAERARVLEQGRIELLSWHNGTPERRALEALRKALQDERLPLPAYTTGAA